jgi:hypothetical protein
LRTVLLTALAGLLMPLVWVPTHAQDAELVGTWRGTSTCVDKVHFPACHDEVVVYEARQKSGAAHEVILRADKLVNGVREFMGEFDLHRAPDGGWVGEYRNARVRVRIVLRVRGSHMTGVMTDEPSGRRVREIAADRVPN